MCPILRRTVLATMAITLIACGEQLPTRSLPSAAALANGPSDKAALEAQINGLIGALYAPKDQGDVKKAFARVKAAVANGRTAEAQANIVAFVQEVLGDFSAGDLLDPNGASPPSITDALRDLLNTGAQFGGLPPPIPASNPLGGDGAVAVVGPAGGTVVAAPGFGGVRFPPGALLADVIVVVERLPNPTQSGQGPLPTTLAQYPLYYEFSTTPSVAQFAVPVTVGLCRLEIGDPFGPINQTVADRLRVAHPSPTNPATIEVLALAPAPFVNCAGVTLASAAGLGGTTSSFSPFAIVDPAPQAPASVSIKSVTYNNAGVITPVNLDNVFGQIEITLNVDPGAGQLAKVSVQIDGVEAAAQTFGAIQADEAGLVDLASEIVLLVNTAKYNATTGITSYKNGPRVIKAVLETSTGPGSPATPAADVSATMTFRNISGFVGAIGSAGATAIDQAGYQWKQGDVTVSGLPVLYGDVNLPFAVPTISAVTFNFGTQVCDAGLTSRSKVASLSGSSWSTTFTRPDAGGVGTVTGYEFRPANAPLCTTLLTLGEVPTVIATGGNGNAVALIGSPALAGGNGAGFLNSPYLAAGGAAQPDVGFAIRLDNVAPTRPSIASGNCSSFLNTNTSRPVVRTGGWVNDALVLNATASDGTTGVCGAGSGNADGPPLVRRQVLTEAVDFGSSRLSSSTQITYQTRIGADDNAADAALPVTSTVSFPESSAPAALRIAARALDLVTNTSGTSRQSISIDRTAPSLSLVCGGTFAADPACSVQPNPWFSFPNPLSAAVLLSFAASDAPSGGSIPSGFFNLAAAPLITSVKRVDPNIGTRWWCPASGTFLIATSTSCGALPVGNWVTGNSYQGPLTQTFAGMGNVEGYYTVTSSIADQAGNTSNQIVATGLYDLSPPTLGSISFPASLNGGSNVTFSVPVTDNIDLLSGTLFLRHAAFPDLFEFPTTLLGTFGSDVFTTAASVSLTTLFIRSVQFATGGVAPGASFVPPIAAAALVTDAARMNSAPSVAPIGAGSIPVGTATQALPTTWSATPFTWNITLLNGAAPVELRVNRDGAPVAPNVGAVTITACAVGPTGTFQNPFTSRVEFWVQAAGATWRKIGQSQLPTLTDNFVTRSWCFSNIWDPEGVYTAPFAPGVTPVNLMAIGVNQIPVGGTLPAGDGLATPINSSVTVVVP